MFKKTFQIILDGKVIRTGDEEQPFKTDKAAKKAWKELFDKYNADPDYRIEQVAEHTLQIYEQENGN